MALPAGTADGLTLEFAKASGALPVAVFPVGFFASTIERSQGAATTGRWYSSDRIQLSSLLHHDFKRGISLA